MSTEPWIAVASEYASNAYLQPTDEKQVGDVALLFNAPTHYDFDALHITATPSLRYSSQGSYSSLVSNYYHMNASAQYLADRDTLTLSGSFGRDSSLYQAGLKAGTFGVRADNTSGSVEDIHLFNERLSFTADLGWSRALYSQNAEDTGAVDYKYFSESGTLAYATDERTKLELLLNAGEYNTLSGVTRSNNYNLQLGADRQLTELWEVNLTAGYAKSYNSLQLFEGPFLVAGQIYGPYYEATLRGSQHGPTYALSLQRQGEQLVLGVTASRAYRPTGFEFLSRTDAAELSAKYALTERWSFNSKLDFQQTNTPYTTGYAIDVHYLSAQLAVDYHWTETWILSLQANWVQLRYTSEPFTADSTGVSLRVAKQFLRIEL